MIIGLGHYAGVGKDTFADYLVSAIRNRGETCLCTSFAKPVKELCYSLLGISPSDKKKDLVLADGYTPRDVWIKIAEAFRDIKSDVWINCIANFNHCSHLVITDVRRHNEFMWIMNQGGVTIKLCRPGYKPISEMDCELLGYPWHYIIGSSGELLELQTEAERIALYTVNDNWPTQHMEDRRLALCNEVQV
jgi:hypothetical protein